MFSQSLFFSKKNQRNKEPTPISNLGPPPSTLGHGWLPADPRRVQDTSQEQKHLNAALKRSDVHSESATQLGVSYSNEMGFASIKSTSDSHKILLTSDILFSFVSFLFTKNSGFFPPLLELGFSLLLNSWFTPPVFLQMQELFISLLLS